MNSFIAPRDAGRSSRIAQPCLNLGTRLIGLEGFAGWVSLTEDSVAGAGVSTSNTALQPSLKEARCRSMQAVMRSTFGIYKLHSRMASPEHICCCSSV
jgi:hypothetical protein